MNQSIDQWKEIYLKSYSQNSFHCRQSIEHSFHHLAERYFQISLRLFYRALEQIFLIERKRLIQQHIEHQFIQQSLQ